MPCAWPRSRLSGAGRPAVPGNVVPSTSASSPIVEAVRIVLQCPDCGSSTTRTEGIPARTACPRGRPRSAATHRSRSRAARRGMCRSASGRRARPPQAGRPTPRPSAGRGWSCRIRRAAPRRRSGWRGSSLNGHGRHVPPQHRSRADLCFAQRHDRHVERDPQASDTPAATCSATSLRCRLHGTRSEAVLAIAICGCPVKAASGAPRRIQARWMYASLPCPPYHWALRRSDMVSCFRHLDLIFGTPWTLPSQPPRPARGSAGRPACARSSSPGRARVRSATSTRRRHRPARWSWTSSGPASAARIWSSSPAAWPTCVPVRRSTQCASATSGAALSRGPGMRPPSPGLGSGSPGTRCSAAGGAGAASAGGSTCARSGTRLASGAAGRARWLSSSSSRPAPCTRFPVVSARPWAPSSSRAATRSAPSAPRWRGAGNGCWLWARAPSGCSPRRSRGPSVPRCTCWAGTSGRCGSRASSASRRMAPGHPSGSALRCGPRRSTARELPSLAAGIVEPGGRLVYIGLSAEPSVVDTRTLVLKDVTATGVLSASGGLGETISLYATGGVDPRPIVAATVGLEQVATVLAGHRPAGMGRRPQGTHRPASALAAPGREPNPQAPPVGEPGYPMRDPGFRAFAPRAVPFGHPISLRVTFRRNSARLQSRGRFLP